MPSEYNKTVLANGLTVISEYVPGVRSVSAGIWVKTGSRNESTANMGAAHFLEHMVFKGTAKRSALNIALALEETGGSINAYTTKEYTVFYTHSLDSQINKSINVLAELVCRPLLKKEEFQKEKQVIIEEIKAVKDTPEEYVFDVFQEETYPDQPMGFPIAGSEESIESFTHEKLVDFWHEQYFAQNFILSVAGNINHQTIVKVVEKYFDFSMSAANNELEAVKNISRGINKDLQESIYQTHICTGLESVSLHSEYRYAVVALSTYLGSGMSSRLFQVIREKYGLAYSIYSFTDFYKDTGIFGIYLACDPLNGKKALDLIHKEIEKLLSKPLKRSAVHKIKNHLKGSILLGLESTSRRMSRMAKNEMWYKKYISIEEVLSEIDKLDADFLLETSKKIFKMEAFNTITIRPYA